MNPNGTSTAAEVSDEHDGIEPIAVIGMACRVPGADNIDQFWANLRDGVESIRFFTSEEAFAAGASARSVADPQHVAAAPVLDDIEQFDAGLFGMTKREAEILDPQHRVFLECAFGALQHAGYDPSRYPGEIGVYGGVGSGEYQWYHLLTDKELVSRVGHMAIALSNNTDYASTLVSYKLNLRGPSLSVSTACSTGLVSVHLACEAVRNGECDMAIAGAASVELFQMHGYVFHEGSILSPDGHCRAFDADAHGTLWGSGGGAVLLKRLSDAIADGDTVHGVILGSAINNDGSDKVGFSAPSVSGQAEVIRQAMGVAGVEPSSISYVEAHGTGTSVGDPIEIKALATAFGPGEAESCPVGTVKPNIGHLAAAAGVIGLIKTILSLQAETIPPTLHFTSPNPAIDFPSTPFRVVAAPEPWPRTATPRRAGVSSFGMGGTNAHAVVQEAPAAAPRESSGATHAVLLSARTQTALDRMTAELSDYLRARPGVSLDDLAHTLQSGRRAYDYRKTVVAADVTDVADVLSGAAPRRLQVGRATDSPRLVMMFPGQGTQRVGMAAGLYETEPVVREVVDHGAELLRPILGFDLRELLFGDPETAPDAAARLADTAVTQPALFVVEYALAQLWQEWGIQPDALIGHSLGEYVAACLAGVFSFADGVRLVAARGQIMQAQEPGAMLSVQLDRETLQLADTGLDLAAVNAPDSTVVSGPTAAIDEYERGLAELAIPVTRLVTSHAFHSRLMTPARDPLIAALRRIDLQPPRIPIVSNLTGARLTDEQAMDPQYWADHLCSPVVFGPGLQALLAERPSVLLEVGPGQALSGLARMQLPAGNPDPVPSLPPKASSDRVSFLSAAARLWTLGVDVDWSASTTRGAHRIPLPGHPFERERFWIESTVPSGTAAAAPGPVEGQQPLDDWFWTPAWKQAPGMLARDADQLPAGPWLVLRHPGESLDGFVQTLRYRGDRVVEVTPGAEYAGSGERYVVRPDTPADFDRLLTDSGSPRSVLYAWTLDDESPAGPTVAELERRGPLAFDGLTWLAQALAAAGVEVLTVAVATRGTQSVIGGDLPDPIGAMVGGVVRVLPQELPGLIVCHVDVDRAPAAGSALLAELSQPQPAELVAYRNSRRWLPDLAATAVTEAAVEHAPIRDGGVYVITGGLGGVGLSIAAGLAQRGTTRLVLVGRSVPPERAEWPTLMAGDGRWATILPQLLAIEAAGSEVLLVAADVTDPTHVAGIREQAIARFGAVNGIVHAAGIAGGTMLEAQSPATAAAVLRPKTVGTLALAEAFADDRLDFMALCSSVTAIAGGLGQLDYCAGNSFLDAFAGGGQAPWPVVSINWGAWLEVGMAAQTSAPAAFLDVQRGTTRQPGNHPLLEEISSQDGSTEQVGVVHLDSATHWVVDEHRIAGVPALPGTGYLELVRAVFGPHAPDDHLLELRDVVFLTPLAVPDGTAQQVRVVCSDPAGGDWRVESANGNTVVEHARGSAHWVRRSAVGVTDPETIAQRCSSLVPAEETGISASGLLEFGPRWSNLRSIRIGADEELAELVAGEQVSAELGEFPLHPALLDEATAFGSYAGAAGAYLPLGYGRLTLRAPLPARFFSHLRHHRSVSAELLSCDITLLDERGTVLVEIADFMLRQVHVDEMADLGTDLDDAGGDGSAGLAGHGEVVEVAPGSGAAFGSSPAGQEVGIAPRDGTEALLRALGSGLGPQVVVTATHMPTLVRGVKEADRNRLLAQLADQVVTSSAETTLGADYVAPQTELQQRLVVLWEQAIGVTGIGIHHDFFELGGNSLVAAQLIARVRATMQLKLPMRVLFESPTVAGMADMIEAGAAAAS